MKPVQYAQVSYFAHFSRLFFVISTLTDTFILFIYLFILFSSFFFFFFGGGGGGGGSGGGDIGRFY